jgi:hypothetical protein
MTPAGNQGTARRRVMREETKIRIVKEMVTAADSRQY